MRGLRSLVWRVVRIAMLVVCLLAGLATCQLWGQAPVITTVAGNGTADFSGDNGSAITAMLNAPYGVAVDGAGNLYIADSNNQRIRKVDTSGIITTIAGNETAGYDRDNVPATSASLNCPTAVAVDSAGNLYIADTCNQRVRKVDTKGIITTIAGNGSFGYYGDNGPATSARLYSPFGMAVDSAGNLYIADQGNHRIRKVDTNGIITTIAGTGTAGYDVDNVPATSAKLNGPSGVAVDSAGNLYIADQWNHRIRKVDTSGIITTIAGNETAGYDRDNVPATSASLNCPTAVAVDSAGNLYIADAFNQRIRNVDPNGIITTIAGTGTAGYDADNVPATSASLNYPNGVAVDSAGNLYIADTNNYRIRKVTLSGPAATHFALSVPASVLAKTDFSFTLTALDQFEKPAVGYRGTVHFTSTDQAVMLPPDYIFTEEDKGTHTFSATLNTPGTQTITATDIVKTSVSGTSDVIAVTDFSLNAVAPIRLLVGGSGSAQVSVNSLFGFNSPVALSVSGLPTGVTASFTSSSVTPPAGGSANSTLSIGISPAVLPSTFTFTVSGVSGGLTHSATVSVTVTDFSLNAVAPIRLLVGGSGSTQVSVNSLFGFNSPVALSVSGLPTGVTASFTSSSVTPPAGGSANSTLNIGISPAVLPSTFTLTVSGVSGGLTHSATVSVTVSDFSLNATTPITLFVGGSGSARVSVNSLFGFNSPVALSVSGMPTGVTASLSSSSVTPPAGGSANATLNLGISPVISASTFTLTVRGDSGGLTHSATVTVTVTADASSLKDLINQMTTAGCIDNAGVANSLFSKVTEAESAIRSGDVRTATDVLTDLLKEIYAQSGKHIATSCTLGDTAFSPVDVLTVEIQALIPTATMNAHPGRRMEPKLPDPPNRKGPKSDPPGKRPKH